MAVTGDKYISFSHFNVRSLSSNFGEFCEAVDGEQLDVIGLSESWLSEGVASEALNIDGYGLVRVDRGYGRGGGVAFYVRDCYKFKVIKRSDGTGTSKLEQVWISLKLHGKNICLGSLYRPPSENLVGCLTDLESSLIEMLPQFDCLIFGSDFNVDFNSNNCALRTLTSFLQKFSLHQIVNTPTRISERSSTLLDIIVTSSMDYVTSAEVLPWDNISDHCLVKTSIKLLKYSSPPIFKTYRDFSHFNYEIFVNDIIDVDWDIFYAIENLDNMVQFLSGTINNILDTHAPFKTCRITKPLAPWITPNIKYMMRLRSRALTKYKKLKTAVSWEDYKRLRNLVTSSIRSEKKSIFTTPV